MEDECAIREAAYESKFFQALSAEVDDSLKQAKCNGGAGAPPSLSEIVVRPLSCQTGSLGQAPLAAGSSPTSIISPAVLHRSTSYADTPIYRSTSISLAELKKPLYGSGSTGSADLDAFLGSNDWNGDEARPRIGAEPSPCLATEQPAQATVVPEPTQQHGANRRQRPTAPHRLETMSEPSLDDPFRRSPDSNGIGSLDRMTLSGRTLSDSPKSFFPWGSAKLETSTSNTCDSVFSHAARLSAKDFSMQAGGAGRVRRQSNPEQKAAGQTLPHRLSLTSQSSRKSRLASNRRQSSPGLQSAGVQKPSNRMPSSSPAPKQAGCDSVTSKQSSPPRRQSLEVDLHPTHGLLSPSQPSSHLPKHRCQTDGCNADLSNCKPYVRRYRLCWTCMKSSMVFVDSKAMRFCQQCSRLHELSMFDGNKKSCRVKLIELKQRRMAL